MKEFLIRTLVFISIPFYMLVCIIISIFGIAYNMVVAITEYIRRMDRPNDNRLRILCN